jgi:hypothetical protein
MAAFFLETILSLLPLVVALHFRRDGADLDLLHGRCEIVVERERVGGVHVPPWGMLLQNLKLGARERLKMSSEFMIDYGRRSLDFLIREVGRSSKEWMFRQSHTSYVRNSPSGKSSKRSRMINAKVVTFRSCFLALKVTRTSALPSEGCHVRRLPECREK